MEGLYNQSQFGILGLEQRGVVTALPGSFAELTPQYQFSL
jgi:hypothetical protein